MRVALVWTRTDGAATLNSLAWSFAGVVLGIPCNGSQAGMQLASILPAVGNTFGVSGSSFWAVNPVYKL